MCLYVCRCRPVVTYTNNVLICRVTSHSITRCSPTSPGRPRISSGVFSRSAQFFIMVQGVHVILAQSVLLDKGTYVNRLPGLISTVFPSSLSICIYFYVGTSIN